MASKNTPIEGQNLLFSIPPSDKEYQANAITDWRELEEQVTTETGPHITRGERAIHLISSLNALAHRNMLIGFDSALNDKEDKKAIWQRYLEGTPIVASKSMSKAERLAVEAKQSFWLATGFTAMKGTGVMLNGEVRTRFNRDWRDFAGEFGDPDEHKDLVRTRSKQRKNLPKDHYLQTVKGWRQSEKAKARKAKQVSTTPSATSSTASSPYVVFNRVPDMPARTPEIDEINAAQLQGILDKFNTPKASDS